MVRRLWPLLRRGAGRFPGVVVVLTLAFLYVPIIAITYLSLSPNPQPTVPIKGVSLRWYNAVLTDTRFIEAILSSVGLGIVSAVGGTTLGLAGAHTIIRSQLTSATRSAVALVIGLPLFIPTVVVAFAIGVTTGIMNLGFGFLPVALGHLFWVLPFTTFLLTARYTELNRQLPEAARDLGADRKTVFVTITLPLLRPALFASALFAFALSFNEFLITFFLAGSGVTTVPLEIFGKVRIGATSFLNAASVLVLLVSALIAGGASVLQRPT